MLAMSQSPENEAAVRETLHVLDSCMSLDAHTRLKGEVQLSNFLNHEGESTEIPYQADQLISEPVYSFPDHFIVPGNEQCCRTS